MANALEFLTRLAGSDYKPRYRSAKSNGRCIECGNPAGEFRNVAARLEYAISALCQNCQDMYFENDTEDPRME